MRKGKIVAALLVVALMLSMLLACAGPAEPAEGEMTDITITSAAVGSGTYVNTVAIAAMIAKNSTWLRATPLPTPGWIDSLRMLATGRSEISGTGGINVNNLMKGTEYFEGEQYTDILVLWPYMFPRMNVVTKIGSPIKTMQDLANASVAVSLPGSSGETDTNALLKGIGVTPKKIVYMAYVDMPSALKDGTVDVVTSTYSLGSPGMMEVTTVSDCFFIPLDDESWAGIEALELGYSRLTIPAGTYRLQDEDLSAVAKSGIFVASTRMSDDMAYEVARCYWTEMIEGKATSLNPKVLGESMEVCKATIAASQPAPPHPGAVRYFKEIGWLK